MKLWPCPVRSVQPAVCPHSPAVQLEQPGRESMPGTESPPGRITVLRYGGFSPSRFPTAPCLPLGWVVRSSLRAALLALCPPCSAPTKIFRDRYQNFRAVFHLANIRPFDG